MARPLRAVLAVLAWTEISGAERATDALLNSAHPTVPGSAGHSRAVQAIANVSADEMFTLTTGLAVPWGVAFGAAAGAIYAVAYVSPGGGVVRRRRSGGKCTAPRRAHRCSRTTDCPRRHTYARALLLQGTSTVYSVSLATGASTAFAGNGTTSFRGDGLAATAASLNGPYRAAVDAFGNVAIAETGGARVRFVNATTLVITTVAGTGVNGYSGDGGPATTAQISRPQGLVFDAAGNLYVADSGSSRVRMVNVSTQIITTVAGGGGGGDGGAATAASLNGASGVALDALGNLYIADTVRPPARRMVRMCHTVGVDGWWLVAVGGFVVCCAGRLEPPRATRQPSPPRTAADP